ncbi:MAG: SPOR domain-containing protein [Methylococcales bacterium]|nr:SPOR domain-containing protein [Methylococcales bacterium]
MAASIQNKKQNLSDDFSDTLDEVLNEAESLVEKKAEASDDEIMDQLIMDDVFDVAEEEIEKVDITENINQVLAENRTDINKKIIEKGDQQDDEFATNDHIESSNVGESMIDDLLDSVDNDENVKKNKFLEIEPLNNDDILITSDENIETVDNNIEAEATMDSNLLEEDFNISSDDDTSGIDEETNQSKNERTTEKEQNKIDFLFVETTKDITKANAAIDQLKTKINELVECNKKLTQQIAVLTVSTNEENGLEKVKKELRSIRRFINDNKVPRPLLYGALGLGGLALLVAGSFGAVGYGAKSDVADLSEVVTTLEEETDGLVATNSKVDFDKLNKQVKSLMIKSVDVNSQMSDFNNTLQSNPLKPVVEDLIEQNGQAQQAIEELVVKVDKLEKRKLVVVASATKKPKKAKVVEKNNWGVNLVSFKQKWYAESKAREFKKKGVPTDVLKVKVKGENWYRLRVKDFKSKYEAAAYAVKVKKTLNLSSVWVTKI